MLRAMTEGHGPTDRYNPQLVADRMAGFDDARLIAFGAACAERAYPLLICRPAWRSNAEGARAMAESLPLLWTGGDALREAAGDVGAELDALYPRPLPPDPLNFDPAVAVLEAVVSQAARVVVAAFENASGPNPARSAYCGEQAYAVVFEIARLAKMKGEDGLPPRFVLSELDCQRADLRELALTRLPRTFPREPAARAQSAGQGVAAVFIHFLGRIAGAEDAESPALGSRPGE